MTMEFQSINIILMLFFAAAYVFVIMEFVDTILEGARLKRGQRIIVGIVNAGALWAIMEFDIAKVPITFLLAFFALFVEFMIFYRDSVKRVYFVASACICHIMALRAFIVSLFAWKMGIPHCEVINSPELAVLSLNAMLILLNIVILVVIKVIPAEKVRIVGQHNDQLIFMNIWLTVFNIFFVVNAIVYRQQANDLVIRHNQLIMPIVVLIGLYVVLFFSIKMSDLLGYQDMHEELVQGYYKEQQYREAFMSEALYSYETNFTKGIILSGFEKYEDQFGEKVRDYTFMQKQIIKRLVHEEDVEFLSQYSDLKQILGLFEEGNMETTTEYRRITETGTYMWVRTVTHLYQDKTTGDVMGFTYVKDIDEEKRHRLELQERAERDSLTGIYNKGTAEMLISAYLELDIERKNEGALFLVDVDNFKNINDHLGHTKGDEVLCELTKSLEGIFRTDDIVGRVGGDEFLVYMKRIGSVRTIEEKAQVICKNFDKVYTSSFGVTYAVSASIGIAVYPGHGVLLEDLYKKADTALYNTKNRGKNGFSIYQGEEFIGYESSRTRIDENNVKIATHFIDNRPGYVFQTLYQSADIKHAIEDVLELLTKHYNYSRGYIFETSEDGQTTSNTFEWCNNGVSAEIDTLKDIPIEAVAASTRSFVKNGKFVMKSLDLLPELDRSVLEPQGIKSMLQFGVFEEKKLKGFIGFDDCKNERHPDDKEVDELGTVCNIIATFLVKHRALEKVKKLSGQVE